MPKTYIFRGISGSGKSTYAIEFVKANPGTVRVNRDAIRGMLWGSEEAFGIDERLVTRIQNASLTRALEAGHDVVVDNTNIEWSFVEQLNRIAGSYGEVIIVDFDVALDVALARNAARERKVPEDVIRNQHA